jgi:photosystem II stability/assembly factor-like uncharacterized protein
MNLVRNAAVSSAARQVLRIALSLIALLAPAMSGAGWYWQSPQPSAFQLWSVAFSGPDTGIAVGQAGSILTTSDGGASWTLRDSGLSVDYVLWRVRFIDSSNAVAIGGFVTLDGEVAATVVHSADAGATWTVPGNSLPNIDFSDAYFRDAENGMAVGVDFATFQPTLSRTSDGGTTWDTQRFGNVGLLKAIAFPEPDVGFAVGADFGQSSALLLGTSDGGDTWAPIAIPSANQLNDVEFADAHVGAIVGNAGTLFTTSDGGLSWQQQTVDTTADLHGVTFDGPGTLVVMGGDYANQGIILISTDGGATWSTRTFDRSIEGVAFGDTNTGTAVGFAGAMLHTTDGGGSWLGQQESVSPNTLFGVAFVDPRVGTAVGDLGTIIRTKDGGTSWRTQASGTSLPLFGVAAVDDEELMAVGGDILTAEHVIVGTTDGGVTWIDRTPPDLLVPMVSVACPASGTCTAVGECGKVVHTDDGGSTWTTQRDGDCSTLLPLLGVAFSDTEHGIAVGRGSILRTENGGETWINQQPPTDEVLNGVTFADADNAYIAAGSTVGVGTILHTSDGGATWSIQRDDLPTNVTSIAFANLNDGIAVTLAGDIYQTHNGGTTWDVHTGIFANLWGVACKENATAVAVGNLNYNAAILGFNDRVFASGFDPD